MIKISMFSMLLPFMQTSFAEAPSLSEEEPKEGTSYLYPFFYDGSDEEVCAPEFKADAPKVKSPTSWHGNIGRAELSVEVENMDYASQCMAKRDAAKKKNKPEKKSRFHNEEEERKESGSPKVSASIKWSSEN